MSRREFALKKIDLTRGKGLELGPLHSPIIYKTEATIFYADHMSTADLREKYYGHPFPLEDIVAVDFVLNNSLKETLGNRRFNYVVASHVIEHIPDLASWLIDIASILHKDGLLSLVIPDKRFTFDIIRNESRPADVIGAYLDNYTRSSSAMIYDFITQVRDNIIPIEVWANPYQNFDRPPRNSIKKAWKACLDNKDPKKYVDAHCHVFTPYSFIDILRNLIKHDLLPFEVVYFKDTPINQLEFYITLKKSTKHRSSKLKSLPKIRKPREIWELNVEIKDLQQQLNQLYNSRSWRLTKPLRFINKLRSK